MYKGKAISACGNKSAANKNMNYKGNFIDRGKELGELVVQDNPDFIFISDWSPITMSSLAETLKGKNYRIYLPKGFENERQPWRFTCISAMAIREDIVFSQTYLEESRFSTAYRYISGAIQKENDEFINILGVHIPQVDTPNERQLSRKGNMINVIRDYMAENTKKRALVFGDFNCGTVGEGEDEFYCQKEFDDLMDIGWRNANCTNENTFNNKQIDYCFASPFIVSKGEYNVNMTLNNEGYKYLTDHKMLDIEIYQK